MSTSTTYRNKMFRGTLRMPGILAELAVGANPTVCSEIRNHASQLRTQIEAQKDRYRTEILDLFDRDYGCGCSD